MNPSEIIRDKFGMTASPEIISPEELTQRINLLLPIVQDFLENRANNPFLKDENPQQVSETFDLDVPEYSDTFENVVDYLKNIVIPRFPSISNPRFLAFIPSDPAPPAMIGALLTPLFNQFTGTVIGSPGGSALESLAIKWIIQLLNLNQTSWGSFTMGGSGANLTCMYTGIVNKAPWNLKKTGLANNKRLRIYTSDQVHKCILKAGMLLGLGEESFREIPTDKSYSLSPEAVLPYIEEDEQDDRIIPIMIIATTGTTNTGAIDDIYGLYELAQKKDLWLHIDGAYGAFAKLAKHKVSKKFNSISLADSIALDCHKWLFTPFEAGLAVVKDSKKLRNAFEVGAEYLEDTVLEEDYLLQRNFRNYGFPLSRELRGLKIWMQIKSYGKQGISQFITRNILVADYLRSRIIEHPNLELMSDGKLSIVCFRWKESDEFNERIISNIQKRRNFYLSRTKLKNKTTIRVCILNLQSTPSLMDELIKEIENIATRLMKTNKKSNY